MAANEEKPDLSFAVKGGWVHLTALSPNLIRVVHSLEKTPPRDPTPVMAAQLPKPHFRVLKSKIWTGISTSELTARVSQSGTVSFFDRANHLISSETKPSLTKFKLPKFPNTAAYHSSLGFNLTPSEALYGLGQHQDGLIDRRGATTLLSQVNMEVAIPFLLSSNGYGVLWNNASRTIFDSGGKLEPSSFIDDHGKPGALTGRYFKGRDFEKLVAERRDDQIDFDWTQNPPPGLPHDEYSVRWTGSVMSGAAGRYTFRAEADDGVRLFVDGKKILDDWGIHPARTSTGSVDFAAHSRHAIRLEFFQATRDSIVRLGWSAPGVAVGTFSSYAAKSIDYCFLYGPKLERVVSTYRDLTGAAPLPPKWALGYWQSKERYATQNEWSEIAEGYRTRQLPIDNLVQDWFYWDPHPWGSHLFDAKRYPDPDAGIAKLHDRYHMHFMISVWGKFAPGTGENPDANYDELLSHNDLYPAGVSDPERYYDAFSDSARAMYWRQINDHLFSKGVDAWWLDASEPEANLKALDETSTGLGPGAFVVSAWPLLHTQGVYQGQRSANQNKRVFILTRSAFAGQQRNGAATWSGDITASWDTLRRQIPAGLNFCMSGIPYWTTDIGAFFVPYQGGADNPDYRELYTRWFEYGAFCPIFRSHGTNTPREMWRFGPQVQEILANYDRLRYRLLPYLYSQAWATTSRGSTIMRALPMDFPSDSTAREVKDEFLFGPSLLVCPVTTPGAKTRKVYLPVGASWIDFWTAKSYSGGQWISCSAPLEKEPIFVRGGAIVPMGPNLQYVSQHPEDPIELRVYPGQAGKFEIYEDEGDGYGYEKGRYATIPIEWDGEQSRLTIGARRGTFQGMLTHRTFRVVRVRPGLGIGGQEATVADATIAYKGKPVTVRL